MAEYIEREAVLKHCKEIIENEHNKNASAGSWADAYEQFIEDLEDAPVADVVEVVRCKECKHHHWEQEPCHGKTEHFCSVLNAQVFKDFYCYHGAKMDGKGEGE